MCLLVYWLLRLRVPACHCTNLKVRVHLAKVTSLFLTCGAQRWKLRWSENRVFIKQDCKRERNSYHLLSQSLHPNDRSWLYTLCQFVWNILSLIFFLLWKWPPKGWWFPLGVSRSCHLWATDVLVLNLGKRKISPLNFSTPKDTYCRAVFPKRKLVKQRSAKLNEH